MQKPEQQILQRKQQTKSVNNKLKYIKFLINWYIIKRQQKKMQTQRPVKKKLVQNFEFDAHDVKIVQGYEIINAKNILLNEIFTLKRLNLNQQQNNNKHQAMLKQISLLKQLNGVNIIKCHKILKSKSHLYLVYDYFSGRNLANLIAKNEEITNQNKKIDKLISLKLHEDFVDTSLIEMIAKQLSQVLKQIQSHKIVHMRFYPQNIILGKNNSVKLANFSHAQVLKDTLQGNINQDIQDSEYLDPYYKQTNNYGYFTDIYSFGIILQKLYSIYEASQFFKENKQLQQLIDKMTQNNPYRRPQLQQIYSFFFASNKVSYDSKNRKSREQGIIKSARIIDRTSQISGSKSQKYGQKPKLRISHNQIRDRNQLKTSQNREALTRSKNSSQLGNSHHSHSQRRKRDSNSPTPTQDSPSNYNSPQSNVQQSQNFKKIAKLILKKRNLSILLLKLGDAVANKVQGQSFYALQLTYLLYKKSLIQIVGLAKYLSKGSKKYFPQISQTMRLRYSKTQDYFTLTKIINQQLEQQRNTLASISSLIKKQCPSILTFGSLNPSTVNSPAQLKPRQTYIPQLPDFEKQLKYQAFNNQYFVKTIKRYLETFISDLLILNKNNENAKQALFYLSILVQIYRCDGYQNFVQQFFTINWSQQSQTASQQLNQKIPTYMTLLKMNPRFIVLGKMNAQQLGNQLTICIKSL